MKERNKSASKKQIWTAMRRPYTGHLRTPFKAKFDRWHWWKDETLKSDVSPSAALYELARRHPLVREAWLRNFAAATHGRRGVAVWIPTIREKWDNKIIRAEPTVSLPPALYWTCLLGLRSWAKLDSTEQSNWKASAGSLKGLDLRDEELQCRSIIQDADCEIRSQRRNALGDKVKGRTSQETGKIVNRDLAVNPVTPEEREAAIAHRSVEAFRQGYLLLAVAPDLHSDIAGSIMEKVYGFARRRDAQTKKRARWKDWLPLVAAFEEAESTNGKQTSQVFLRYQRVINGISFE
jgi:hypothetical protein